MSAPKSRLYLRKLFSLQAILGVSRQPVACGLCLQ